MIQVLIVTLLPAIMFAGQIPRIAPKLPIYNVPITGGDELLAGEACVSPERGVFSSLDETYVMGTTYYDYQHNGTTGRMVRADATGWVHFVWTNGLDVASGNRHIFYNLWDPASESFSIYPTGVQVDNRQRAGYTSQALRPDGFCFPAFHLKTADNQIFGHSAAAFDFLPQTGAFQTIEPDRVLEGGEELELDWPKIDVDIDGVLHMISTENPLSGETGDPQRLYYSRGIPTFGAGGVGTGIEWQDVDGELDYMLFDTVTVISADIVCSRYTNKVAIAWSATRDDLINDTTQYNNDLHLMISEDGGENWSEQINITNFEYPDFNCLSGDTVECDRDTFRVYTDCSILMDEEDVIHIAFTSCYLYELEGTINIVFSDVWHWDEAHEYFSNIAHGEFNTDSSAWVDPGAWQRVVQRPSLAIDTTTGYLYCSFQRYDTLQSSSQGWPQADAYMTMSTDGGIWWSEAVNVTNTNGGLAAPEGQSMSERDISIAPLVTYANGEGYLHMEYVYDLDAGGIVQEEGIATLNPVVYNRLNVNAIPEMPLHNVQYPVLRIDSTGFPPDWIDASEVVRTAVPGSFTLYQNYPNPFNPTTSIQFDLVQSAQVTVGVYDVTGREVAAPINNQVMSAGTHVVEFDGSRLSSGVYFYRLEMAGMSQSRKMVLLK
jgi:hypothetical protein